MKLIDSYKDPFSPGISREDFSSNQIVESKANNWLESRVTDNTNQEVTEALDHVGKSYTLDVHSNQEGNSSLIYEMENKQKSHILQDNPFKNNMSVTSESNLGDLKNSTYEDFIFGAIGKSVILCKIEEQKIKYQRQRNFSITSETEQLTKQCMKKSSSKFLQNQITKIQNRAIKLHIKRISKQFFKELPNYLSMLKKLNKV